MFEPDKIFECGQDPLMIVGHVINAQNFIPSDLDLLGPTKKVMVKQYDLTKDLKGFKREMKLLKKIKNLKVNKNGGFPVILSAKLTKKLGEIMMTHVGDDLLKSLGLHSGAEQPLPYR